MTAREFGRLVREGRQAFGMTQRELARAINTGERFVVELEAGKGTSQLGKALAAARALGVRVSAPPRNAVSRSAPPLADPASGGP